MEKKILITGATGLIGSKITNLCRERGITVHYFTTSEEKIKNEKGYKGFLWNPTENSIDKNAFEGVTAVVNLVGASISKRWTKDYKKTIVNSRVDSMNLLYQTLREMEHSVGFFVSASGINVYPSSQTKLYTEEDEEIADTFLGEVVEQWEAAADQFKKLGMDVAKVRTGMVLAKEGGAFPMLLKPIKMGVGSPLGNGKQWQSWIHIEDIAGIYMYLLENNLEGLYNAVAPDPVQNRKMVKLIAEDLDAALWMPNAPAFVLKTVLGEMSDLVLESQLVDSKKIREQGYTFLYANIESALKNLLSK